MTKELFIQPRFVGPRFEGHVLPVSAAKDLAAYEELVIELAKRLYLQKHQHRERVPKGFGSGFRLAIEQIEDGSARPALVAIFLGQLLVSLPQEVIEAKDLINEVIATEAGQSFPAAFPKEYYSYFNRIGRSLEEGEQIEWTPESQVNKSSLTPVKRKRLVLAHREFYEADVDVIGLVEALDTKRKSGTLRNVEKDPIAFTFEDVFFSELKDALGNPSRHVRVQGIGAFDVNDKLCSIIEVDQVESLPHYTLVTKIENLAQLKNGWLDGHGVAPAPANLELLSNEIEKNFPESFEYPSVAPTEEGNVVLEWIRPLARIEMEINFSDRQLEIYATNLNAKTFLEKTFSADDWRSAFTVIDQLLSS